MCQESLFGYSFDKVGGKAIKIPFYRIILGKINSAFAFPPRRWEAPGPAAELRQSEPLSETAIRLLTGIQKNLGGKKAMY
ncbi:hypothetical protein [Cyclobacterium salsum]|uniref:hypothetical protein n=1 Tax=Cyclobacterium salsum TaxID=2666329 RepID=UPI0013912533|nr:hypothetical protein [Cyclobacterium salsum]